VPLCHVPAQLQETARKKTVSTCFLPYIYCIQLAGSQKETTSARHCSAADFLKTTQKETTYLAVPCMFVQTHTANPMF